MPSDSSALYTPVLQKDSEERMKSLGHAGQKVARRHGAASFLFELLRLNLAREAEPEAAS